MTNAINTVKLIITPITPLSKMLLDHNGINFNSFFKSSTSSTVHWLHDFVLEFAPSLINAALFKNLIVLHL